MKMPEGESFLAGMIVAFLLVAFELVSLRGVPGPW